MARRPKLLESASDYPMSASEAEALASLIAQSQALNQRLEFVVIEARRRLGIPMEIPLEIDVPNKIWKKKVPNGEAPKSQA